jgi:hypothetical protein
MQAQANQGQTQALVVMAVMVLLIQQAIGYKAMWL